MRNFITKGLAAILLAASLSGCPSSAKTEGQKEPVIKKTSSSFLQYDAKNKGLLALDLEQKVDGDKKSGLNLYFTTQDLKETSTFSETTDLGSGLTQDTYGTNKKSKRERDVNTTFNFESSKINALFGGSIKESKEGNHLEQTDHIYGGATDITVDTTVDQNLEQNGYNYGLGFFYKINKALEIGPIAKYSRTVIEPNPYPGRDYPSWGLGAKGNFDYIDFGIVLLTNRSKDVPAISENEGYLYISSTTPDGFSVFGGDLEYKNEKVYGSAFLAYNPSALLDEDVKKISKYNNDKLDYQTFFGSEQADTKIKRVTNMINTLDGTLFLKAGYTPDKGEYLASYTFGLPKLNQYLTATVLVADDKFTPDLTWTNKKDNNKLSVNLTYDDDFIVGASYIHGF